MRVKGADSDSIMGYRIELRETGIQVPDGFCGVGQAHTMYGPWAFTR